MYPKKIINPAIAALATNGINIIFEMFKRTHIPIIKHRQEKTVYSISLNLDRALMNTISTKLKYSENTITAAQRNNENR
jgi:hypothetical protein